MMKLKSFFKRHVFKVAGAAAVVLALLVPFFVIEPAPVADDVLSIAATFSPVAAVMEGVMEGVPGTRVHQIAPRQDICLRSYEMSDWDLYSMAGGFDAVVYGGRGLERFESVILALDEYGIGSCALLSGAKLLTGAPGDAESHFSGENPHAYLSYHGMTDMIRAAEAFMAGMDPAHAAEYARNAAGMIGELSDAVDDITLVPGESVGILNEALLYVARDFDLAVAFQYERESGEDLTGSALEDLIEEAEAAGVRVLFVESHAPASFTDALEKAGFAVVQLNTMSNVAGSFDSYLAAFSENIARVNAVFSTEVS